MSTRNPQDAPAAGHATPADKGPVVLIPARNEASTIAAVVSQAREALGCEVVVIDDASTDATATLARTAGATVLPLRICLGAWGATQTGLRYAQRCNYAVAVTMDADGQHLAQMIGSLLQPLQAGQADVVIGACPQRASRARWLAWRVFRMLTGFALADLTSGFRAYNRDAIATLAARDATLLDHQDIGVLLLLRLAGLHIVEVPVTMQPRTAGHSRVFYSWFAVLGYLLQTGVLCLARWTPQPSRRHRAEQMGTGT